MRRKAKAVYEPRIVCSICGCDKYTKYGNTAGGQWCFECSNGHMWWYLEKEWCINMEFPWREDDYYHPKNYACDIRGRCRRLDDSDAVFPRYNMTKAQWRRMKGLRDADKARE